MLENLRFAPPASLTTREAIEGEIERLLSVLDDMDGDCDLEDGNDDEDGSDREAPGHFGGGIVSGIGRPVKHLQDL